MNDKVKSLFFSQYLGQKIRYRNDFGSYQTELIFGNPNTSKHIKDGYLLLRDISQLEDFEYENIGRLFFPKYSYPDNSIFKAIDVGKEVFRKQKISNLVYQYLLRIGVLVPLVYLSETNQPITLTPAEIINLGWAKIKEDEQ